MSFVWGAIALAGFFLTVWAYAALPEGTDMRPIPPKKLVFIGPYKKMKHPMYTGNTMILTGLGGLAAGWWGALAIGSLADLMMRVWKMEEEAKD